MRIERLKEWGIGNYAILMIFSRDYTNLLMRETASEYLMITSFEKYSYLDSPG